MRAQESNYILHTIRAINTFWLNLSVCTHGGTQTAIKEKREKQISRKLQWDRSDDTNLE